MISGRTSRKGKTGCEGSADAQFCACPTCGSPLRSENIRVDLARNFAVCSNGVVTLEPRLAEVLSVLADSYPNHVSMLDLAFALFGHSEHSSDAWALIRVHVSKLRKKLEPLGWTIPRTHRWDRGYCLQKMETGADQRAMEGDADNG